MAFIYLSRHDWDLAANDNTVKLLGDSLEQVEWLRFKISLFSGVKFVWFDYFMNLPAASSYLAVQLYLFL